tara:strand:+ start:2562 stop:3332 length:771 start_codon:yes stop_codon:yes gene_type:complete
MKKIIIILFSIIFITVSNNAYAAKGAAKIYKVTMSEAALCTGNSSGTTCDGKVVVGSGDQTVDIAAVDAGATAATYGDVALLPLGTTYTHMYVKISRKFVIKTDDDSDLKTDNGDVCRSRANADSMYDSDEATDKYTHVPTRAEGTSAGAAAEQNSYLMNAGTNGVKFCTNATCGGTANQTFGYTCAHCTAQKTDLDSNDNYHELIYALSTPYTVTMIPPTITMSFGTAQALSANDVTGSVCNITAEEPVFTVTVE